MAGRKTGGRSTDPIQLSRLQEEGLERSRQQNVQALAKSDPESALKLAETITDPALRARSLVRVAQEIQRSNPPKAQELTAEASSYLKTLKGDDEGRLNLIVQLVRAASARKDATTLWAYVNQGLDLAEDLFERDLRLTPAKPAYSATGFEEANELMSVGMEKEATSTYAWLSRQHSSVLKSYLLISAAEGLWTSRSSKSDTNP